MPSIAKPAVPSDLKYNNRRQVLEAFKWGSEYTVNQLAEQIGLSRQTIMKTVQFFVEKGLLTFVGKGDSTAAGGKRPDVFALTDQQYLLCIDLWPDQLNLTLLDLKSRVVDCFQLRQALPDRVPRVLEIVEMLSSNLLAHNCIAMHDLRGVCISTSGIVNYKTQALRYNSNAPAWGLDIPIPELLRPCFGSDVKILAENVAKLTARALLRQKELLDKRVLVVFTAWGLSGCLIDKGHIMNGKDSLIGEFGHMILSPDDEELCGCGSRGCFERLVSNERLRQRVGTVLPQHPTSILNTAMLPELTVQTVFAASAQGDACARQLVEELARLFAMALRNITLIFDPDLVVFQGDYAASDPFFLQQLRCHLMEFQYYPSAGPFTVQLDKRPLYELSLQGAYTILMDRLLNDASAYL